MSQQEYIDFKNKSTNVFFAENTYPTKRYSFLPNFLNEINRDLSLEVINKEGYLKYIDLYAKNPGDYRKNLNHLNRLPVTKSDLLAINFDVKYIRVDIASVDTSLNPDTTTNSLLEMNGAIFANKAGEHEKTSGVLFFGRGLIVDTSNLLFDGALYYPIFSQSLQVGSSSGLASAFIDNKIIGSIPIYSTEPNRIIFGSIRLLTNWPQEDPGVASN